MKRTTALHLLARSAPKVARVALFLLLPLVLFHWLVPAFGRLDIGQDYGAYSIQQQMELWHALRGGTFPLFVPGFAGGQTAAALTLGQLYHPIFLTGLLPGYGQGGALEWNTLWRLLSLGFVHWVLFGLLRRLGLDAWLAFTVSFPVVYNLRMLDLFRYGAALESYTGMLLLCAALVYVRLRPGRWQGTLAVSAATYLTLVSGHPQMAYLGIGAALFTAAFAPALVPRAAPACGPARYYGTIALSMAAGAGLAAAYLMPFHQDFLLRNGARAAQDYAWSLAYGDTLGGLAASFFAPLRGDLHGAFAGSALFALLPFLPLLALRRGGRRRLGAMGLWALLALVFVLALGAATPLHRAFWEHVPFASSLRGPSRLTQLLPFPFLMLLAWALRDGLAPHPSGRRLPALWLPIGAALLATLLFPLVSRWLPQPAPFTPERLFSPPAWIWAALAGLWLVSLLALAFHLASPAGSSRASQTVIAVIMAGATLFSGILLMRHGTWTVAKKARLSWQAMAKAKKARFQFLGDPGFGMEDGQLSEQRRLSASQPVLARFFRGALWVRDRDAAYAAIAQADVSRRLVLEGPLRAETDEPGSSGGTDRLELSAASYNRLRFQVDAEAPGHLVLRFPYSSNWRVSLDGAPGPRYRANGAMLATPVPAGRHTVEFRYWSRAAALGVGVSCLALFLLAATVTWRLPGAGRRIRLQATTVALLLAALLFLLWRHAVETGTAGVRYRWDSSLLPRAGNMAFAKPTAASSLSPGQWPGIAVDGDIFHRLRSARETGPWWQVDLGRPCQLADVAVHFRGVDDAMGQLPLQLLASTDGIRFRLLAETAQAPTDGVWRLAFTGEWARIVRLRTPARTRLSFSEMEVITEAR